MALLAFLFSQRNLLSADLTLDPELARKDRWKILLLRLLAFAAFLGLSYLVLRTPLQEIREGVMEIPPGRFSHVWTTSFVDTEPKRFLDLYCHRGILYHAHGVLWACDLDIQSKESVLGKKAQADAKEIELH